MLSNPKHGWCNFDAGDFHGTPSYITDVPVDILHAFVEYYKTGCGIAWFDEEGSEFSFVLNPYSCFIIEEKDEPVLHNLSELNINDMTKELIRDIESDIDTWSVFSATDSDCRKELTEMIQYLKDHDVNVPE